MTNYMTLTLLDHSNEQSTVRIPIPDLDAANIDDYVNDNLGGALGDIRLAMAGLSSMNHLRRTVQATTIVDAATLPADANAQRERKALVSYRDVVTGKLHSLTIPGFNMTGAEQGTDILDLDVPLWVAFVTAFEAWAQGEGGGAVEVISAKHVGRAS